MVGAPPPTSLHGHLPPLVNLISSLFHCLGSFVPLQSPSLCSQAHALFYKLSKEFFNRLDRFCDPDRCENDLFAARNRIASESVRNAPVLPLNYRDTRSFMAQNANGI